MKRISPEEIDSVYHYTGYTTWDLHIALDKVAQAQKESCGKEHREEVKEIFEAYDDMLDGMGKGQDDFKVSDWDYIQVLKQKHLGDKV